MYCDNVMGDRFPRDWCRKFRDGRTNVHEEGEQGRHSIVTDELVQKVDQGVRENIVQGFLIFLTYFLKF